MNMGHSGISAAGDDRELLEPAAEFCFELHVDVAEAIALGGTVAGEGPTSGPSREETSPARRCPGRSWPTAPLSPSAPRIRSCAGCANHSSSAMPDRQPVSASVSSVSSDATLAHDLER